VVQVVERERGSKLEHSLTLARVERAAWLRAGSLRAAFVGLLACGLLACSGSVSDDGKDDESAGPDSGMGTRAGRPAVTPCMNERDFSRQVWGRVLGKVCINCHAPDGVAADQNAMLRLLPSAYPGFLDANFESASYVAKFSFDGKSLLLRKPLGEMSHGGGVQLKEGEEEYAILSDFVRQVEQGDACTGAADPPTFDDLTLLDADSTYRKATLQLAGRLPTTAERDRLRDEGEAALPALLDALMREEAFIDRVVELYNDKLLTDFYLRYVGAAIGLLGDNDYPNAAEYYDMQPDDVRERANRGVAREPLWIIGHVVRNDRPFSEILTADYTVVSAGSAMVYGVETTFSSNSDRELQETQVQIQRPAGFVPVPHAGLLSTPAFLNRFPTSPTNRGRHRARKIYEFFLATDILKSGARPLDPLAATSFNNPTRDDPQCNGCHRQLDPIAGGFLKWNERDQERYEPDQQWHTEMVAPGFGQEVMDTDEYGDALQWLGARIVADPRFVLSTVYTAYEALTGHEPLSYPRADEPGDGLLDEGASTAAFDAKLSAWEAQDATFRAVGQRFVDENMNFKTVVRELVLSPYFRAHNTAAAPNEARAGELIAMGTGRLLSPERLSLKIAAVTGVPWARGKGERPFLLTDYKILYGGIDSDTVVDRLSQPNGIMANVALRMANEVSCRATAWDFTLPDAERVLFPGVTLLDVPESETGAEVPAQVERIKKTIAHLYAQLLDETPDDAELTRVYGLFYETWKDGLAGIGTGTYPKTLPSACRAREDPRTGEALIAERRIENDERYTVRAWMAVMTYLLSDYGFLHE
jgi:hypothetical protein